MKKEISWPGNAPAAAMVSVMLDAEFIWLEMDPIEFGVPKHRSMGEYGPRRGVDKILDSLKKYHIKATFFVPGVATEVYPDVIKKIYDDGHEIALHGYNHEKFSRLTYEDQTEVLEKGKKALAKLTGVQPKGFRLPEGEARVDSIRAIAEAGFLYDSSFFDNDIPYIVDGTEMVEIPMRWETVDFPYLAWGGSYPKGASRVAIYDDVLDNWLREMEAYRNGGFCYGITFTPQLIGSPGRRFMIDKVLEKLVMKRFWIATGEEIAQHVKGGLFEK